MKNALIWWSGLALAILISACNSATSSKADVILHTEKGDIALKLYDDTPKHKANFLKLASEGYFDGMAFHRIVAHFMVQTGDPATKPGANSRNNGPGYTIPAEISLSHTHVAGVLGAARENDEVNPKRESAGSQFFIVTGRHLTAEKLDSMEMEISAQRRETLAIQYSAAGSTIPFDEYLKQNGYQPFTYTAAQREQYLKYGGAPWLDNGYTAFGEVVSGMPVVQAISKLPVLNERPQQIVRITKVEVVKN